MSNLDMLAQLTESFRGHKNSKELMEFANRTWQQLEEHAAQGPDSYKKFQKATLSVALNTAPSDPDMAQKTPSITIKTSMEASTASLLINTAPVVIHIFRAAPSFAAAMSGKVPKSKPPLQAGASSGAMPFKVRWQSCKVTKDTEEQVTMYVDCPAKIVDAVTDGKLPHAKGQLLDQMLTFLERQEGVQLARRSAELHLPGASAALTLSTGRLDDPVPAHHAASHLPATLVSKLSLVSAEESADKLASDPESSEQGQLIPTAKQFKRPLIQELE